ncbi:MAG TPA: TIGR04086 family membrane protein [Clostridiales bacterium]|nr:MAG: hypothetical protein A2Y18_01195 [Clostridiales bacterium GWD2_32_19]HCC08092.1 TIGR04086 family membrane protein [Clostridiales bacterium]
MKNFIIQLFKGVLLSYIVTLILLLFFSFLLTYASIDDNSIGIGIAAITIVSLFIGGFFAARNLSMNGWLSGLLVGGVYFVLLAIITFGITNEFGFSSNSLKLLSTALIGGVLGGIIGVNTKNN